MAFRELINDAPTVEPTASTCLGCNCPKMEKLEAEPIKHGRWLKTGQSYVKIVRCKDCKHRILNEHYGEKGYSKLKAICEYDTGDPFELGRNAEDDDWFCADAERKE